jgi:hypothetical protein
MPVDGPDPDAGGRSDRVERHLLVGLGAQVLRSYSQLRRRKIPL